MTRSARLLVVSVVCWLLLAAPAAGVLFLSDDFDSVSGGSGFATASSWGAGLSIVTSTPAAPSSPEGLSSATAAFRSLDPGTAASIDAQSELWVGFLARLGQAKTAATYAGVSFYALGAEQFFMGADWDGTSWGIQTVNYTAGSSSVPAGTSWVSLLYHFDFGAGHVDLYVDGSLEVSGYLPMPARGWDQIRIASSTSHPIYVDQLRIGTSQADARPSLGLVAQSTENAPIFHCRSDFYELCTFETEETDCPGSFCETTGDSCNTTSDCAGVCDTESGLCPDDLTSCVSDADCHVTSCSEDRSRRCGSWSVPTGFMCTDFCEQSCSSGMSSCQQDSHCTGTCDLGFCSNNGFSCTADGDCNEGTCEGYCRNTLESCESSADCDFGSCTPEGCVEDFCDTRDEDIPVYNWKLCPQCGQTTQDLGAGTVVVPTDGIPFNRFGVGECLFDQSTDIESAVIGYSPIVLTGGIDCCAWQATCQPQQTCGNLDGMVVFQWGSMGSVPTDDSDGDGMPDACDNCPEAPNFGTLGVCVAGPSQNIGAACTSHAGCGSGGVCSLLQQDGDSDGLGDACDPDVIPEPGGTALLLPGIALLGMLGRSRRRTG